MDHGCWFELLVSVLPGAQSRWHLRRRSLPRRSGNGGGQPGPRTDLRGERFPQVGWARVLHAAETNVSGEGAGYEDPSGRGKWWDREVWAADSGVMGGQWEGEAGTYSILCTWEKGKSNEGDRNSTSREHWKFGMAALLHRNCVWPEIAVGETVFFVENQKQKL